MRADRLLSMLMLLQARGRITADELADELEVSVRTIYRDVDALCYAGIPIYTERGPGGGIALMDDYRTTLTGLNEDERRVLLMLSMPSPLVDLGLKDDWQAALRKLGAALPTTAHAEETRIRQRLFLDATPWPNSTEPTPHLHILHEAVWQDLQIDLAYWAPPFIGRIAYRVSPYGLVAKANRWYLIFAREGRIRALEIVYIIEATMTDETFTRPADFDLQAIWKTWRESDAFVVAEPKYRVVMRIAPDLVPWLPLRFGRRMPEVLAAAPTDDSGWKTITHHFESIENARMQILGFGGAVEVIEPIQLRQSIADFARQISGVYDKEH